MVKGDLYPLVYSLLTCLPCFSQIGDDIYYYDPHFVKTRVPPEDIVVSYPIPVSSKVHYSFMFFGNHGTSVPLPRKYPASLSPIEIELSLRGSPIDGHSGA